MRGHLRERSPGRWAIVIDVRDPTTGKRKRKWHSFIGTKRQAQVECAKLIAESKNGTALDPAQGDAAGVPGATAGPLKWSDSRSCPRSAEEDRVGGGALAIQALGSIKLAELRPEHIAAGLRRCPD